MFKVTIKTDNAAFHDYDNGNGEFDDYAKGEEIARILREVIEKLENGYTSGYCMDINGNNVGKWSVD